MAEGIAESMGGSCEFNIVSGYPFLVNEPVITAAARAAAEEYLGKENVLDLDIWMAAEDFAYYAQNVPAIFYRLGITDSKTKEPAANLHTASFDIDEKSLITGCSCMAKIAIDMLSELNNKHL